MKLLLPFLLVISLSGCVTLPTGPSVSMSPARGKPFDLYQSEDGKCRLFSERQIGKDYDYFSTQEAQRHYDYVYVQCMRSHGNQIKPPVVYRRYRNSSPLPPADYYDPPTVDYSIPQPGNYSVPPPGTPPPPN